MQPDIELFMEKLAAPVEALPIRSRVYRPLRRASIYTIAEVVLTGHRKLTSIRGIGGPTAKRLLEAAASYLGMPDHTFTDQDAVAIAGEAPISVLALPLSILHDLGSLGLFYVRSLLKSRRNQYSNILGMQEHDLRQIDQALTIYLAGVARAGLEGFSGTRLASVSPMQSGPQAMDLGFHLRNLGIDERAWRVLELRSTSGGALGKISTAVGLGGPHSVANVIRRVHEDLHCRLSSLAMFLDDFEQRVALFSEHLGTSPLEQASLIHHLLPGPVHSCLRVQETDLKKMMVLVRTLVLHRRIWFAEESVGRWEKFTALCCQMEPPIRMKAVRRMATKGTEPAPPRIARKDLIRMVLARAGKPLHVVEILREVRALSGEDDISTGVIRNCMIERKDLFVRVGQSVYALREWGHRDIEVYNAIVAALLKEAKTAMPLDWIFERVAAVRPVTRGSLRMCLTMHPRFYRSVCGTYGLRSWLPEGGTSSSSVPGWLMEDQTSARRVERSKAHGYNVERLLNDDRLR